ncbi:hypothetical protein JAAARDRAFT_689563 [Jaapia argillacea MUCL 33604]|uniref:RING-type domain-containing protein n=1 Tax=Jaapia argillacea MUCL 33604 TaxID=933084 RepID=A0A067PZJ5_9AGAM|nr:hypothetical protein JAAARDRAFT_689563 [Jaapia argillacea MUCL 33604]
MTKHSKNNTASSVFSYAEYKKLDYGTKRQRLGNESMRRFDACALCLQRAREPLACQEGHLFCKECVYTDLLTQKKDIKRQKERLEVMKREAEEEKRKAMEAARERVLRDFEKDSEESCTPPVFVRHPETNIRHDLARGLKRKFAFDSTTVETLTREAEESALRQIEREQADALRAKLPDFWLPSLTPTYGGSGPPSSLKDIKVQTTCRGGNPPHSIILKNLIPVKFTFLPPTEEDDPICPSCKKTFSNSIKMFWRYLPLTSLLPPVMKSCAHVVCKTCTESLVRPAKQCVVCDKVLAEKDIIALQREGTGFAGGGLAETTKTGLSFQG